MSSRPHASRLTAPTVSVLVAIALLAIAAIRFDPRLVAQAPTPGRPVPVTRPAGWSDATHGPSVKPDYARLFSMDRVHEIHITIPADRYKAMQEDLTTIGPAGRGGFPGGPARVGGPAPGAPGPPPPPGGPGVAGAPPGGPGRMFGRGPIQLTSRDPIYVPVTVTHDGKTWTSVGMRYKGNSSLVATAAAGNGKVPFRLNFDQYETDVPAIANQHFYGFGELTFSSNFGDNSQIREALASEAFRDRGVPAPRTAFYRVMVDAGNGFEYWGLYTLVEDPADGAMLDALFGSRTGNLYKPDGPGADWSAFDEAGFEKKTNKQPANFNDVKAALAALHAPRADAATWRRNLEATLDVNGFVRWLAVNAVIENWDAYGVMPHNYYLYAPTAQSPLRWISWDHNFSFGLMPDFGAFGRMGRGGPGAPGGAPAPQAGAAPAPPPGDVMVVVGRGGPQMPPGGGGRGGFGGMFAGGVTGSDILGAQIGDEWPLISKLLADDVYRARYRTELGNAMSGLLESVAFAGRVRQLHRLVTPSVIGPDGERPSHTTVASVDAFAQSVDGPSGLIPRLEKRKADVRAALSNTPAR